MDDDKLIHFMIVSADYVLDTVSKYEPDEYYLSKLTCSDSTKISLWHNLLCNFIDFSWYCLIPKFTQKAKAEWLKNIANKPIFQCLSQKHPIAQVLLWRQDNRDVFAFSLSWFEHSSQSFYITPFLFSRLLTEPFQFPWCR